MAAALAAHLPVQLLGPDGGAGAIRHAVRDVASGFTAGARDLARHRSAGGALLAISGTRLLFGVSTIGTLLLYRNYFHSDGLLRAGLVGLRQAFGASAIGYAAAAFITPAVTARLGKPRWIAHAFVGAALDEAACGLPFALGPLLIGATLLGFATQSTKICVDTVIQEDIDDRFRDRVFSFYDMSFNLTFVVAAVFAAFVLPENDKSYIVSSGSRSGTR